ncbi:phage/plasmid replication domain-containing protein [Kineobactrum salinum]|uniref:Replication-associated protein G2P C-terminal domain-containing protein n=1 Tax=Kineobactrum salinum TaxID=2708301 RepID=A0A6C0U634_9GAMM|nr:hypothetical protein G3T16_20760 [Kineobactrum salinum]
MLWKEGVDVRPMMSKPTFYRHRSELLPLGIDIALPNEQVECEIIPLFRKSPADQSVFRMGYQRVWSINRE